MKALMPSRTLIGRRQPISDDVHASASITAASAAAWRRPLTTILTTETKLNASS